MANTPEGVLRDAIKRFLDRIVKAPDSVRFNTEARELVMESVDDFQDTLSFVESMKKPKTPNQKG